MSKGENGEKTPRCARLSTQDAKREVYLSGSTSGARSFNLKSSNAIPGRYAKDVPLIGAAKKPRRPGRVSAEMDR